MTKTAKTAKVISIETAKRSRPHNLKHLERDRGYRFQDRDPSMIELCDIIYNSELDVKDIVQLVSKASGGAYSVGKSTIYNWLNGTTKRPQSFGMNWVGFALGYERKWTKI